MRTIKYTTGNICLTFVLSLTLVSISPYGAAAEEPQEKKTLAGYLDDGFVVQSPDGNWRLIPGFRLQLRHQYDAIEDDSDTNGFFLRRGRIKFEGNLITKDLEYEAEFDFGTPDPGDPQFDLKDAYLDYRVTDWFHTKAGQFKTPFGLQENTSSGKLQFVERSLASEEFTHGRDLGFMIWGEEAGEHLVYKVGVFNGDSDNNLNANKDVLLGTQLFLTPLGKYKTDEPDLEGKNSSCLALGVNAFFNKVRFEFDHDGDPATDDIMADDNIAVLGAFAGYKFKGFSLRGEYFNRLNLDDLTTEADQTDAQGFYAQAGYFLIPKKFEGALRSSQVFRQGADNNEQEYAAVLNWYFHKHHAKLQLEYSLLMDEDAIVGADDETRHIVRTQAQVSF